MLDELKCISCRYSLKGLRSVGKCPECGLDVLQSIAGQGNRKLHEYEEKLLAREKNYRTNRYYAVGFSIAQLFMAVVFFIVTTRNANVPDETLFTIVSMAFGAPFWLLVAYGQHARVKHVESIKESRKLIARAYGALQQ